MYVSLFPRLLIGIMFTSWFLSFWLPNIATVAMMVPIVDAVIRALNMAARSRFRHPIHTLSADKLSIKRVDSDDHAVDASMLAKVFCQLHQINSSFSLQWQMLNPVCLMAIFHLCNSYL